MICSEMKVVLESANPKAVSPISDELQWRCCKAVDIKVLHGYPGRNLIWCDCGFRGRNLIWCDCGFDREIPSIIMAWVFNNCMKLYNVPTRIPRVRDFFKKFFHTTSSTSCHVTWKSDFFRAVLCRLLQLIVLHGVTSVLQSVTVCTGLVEERLFLDRFVYIFL